MTILQNKQFSLRVCIMLFEYDCDRPEDRVALSHDDTTGKENRDFLEHCHAGKPYGLYKGSSLLLS